MQTQTVPTATTTASGLTRHWQSSLPDITMLRDKRVQFVFNRTPNVDRAFRISERSLGCVDEGITRGVHLAGSGVLMPQRQRQQEIIAAGITEFTTHDNCGAFALRFPDKQDKNECCRSWGQIEAERLGLPHRHITAKEMDRPEETHNATVIYYDGSGAFNRLPGMPQGFVVSRKYFSTAPGDLELCVNIAFSPHDFGSLFTKRVPLHIVVIANPEEPRTSQKLLQTEAQNVASKFGRGRIRVTSINPAWYMRQRAQP